MIRKCVTCIWHSWSSIINTVFCVASNVQAIYFHFNYYLILSHITQVDQTDLVGNQPYRCVEFPVSITMWETDITGAYFTCVFRDYLLLEIRCLSSVSVACYFYAIQIFQTFKFEQYWVRKWSVIRVLHVQFQLIDRHIQYVPHTLAKTNLKPLLLLLVIQSTTCQEEERDCGTSIPGRIHSRP